MSTQTERKQAFANRLEQLQLQDKVVLHMEDGPIEGLVVKLNKASFVIRTAEGDDHKIDHTSNWEKVGDRTMSEILSKYRERYVVSIAPSGRKSLSTGDELAQLLEMLTGKRVCLIAEQALKIDGLWEKYQNLNNGQQRMNAGNRIRAALKRGEISIEDVAAAKAATE